MKMINRFGQSINDREKFYNRHAELGILLTIYTN